MFSFNRSNQNDLPATGPDSYPLSPDDPLADAHALLSDLFRQYMANGGHWFQSTFRKDGFGGEILALEPVQKRDVLLASIERLDHLRRKQKDIPKAQRHVGDPSFRILHSIASLISFKLQQALLRTKMPLNEADLLYFWNKTDMRLLVIKQVQWYYQKHPRKGKLFDLLTVTYLTLKASKVTRILTYMDIEGRNSKLKEQLYAILHPESVIKKKPEKKVVLPEAGNAWSDDALAHVNSLGTKERQLWEEIFTLAAGVKSPQPSKTHMKKVHALVDQFDDKDSFFKPLMRWLSLMGAKGKHRQQILWSYDVDQAQPHADDEYTLLIPANAQMLKGLVFCCYGQTQPDIVETVGHVARQSYYKLREYGARSILVGNAALMTLAGMPCKESVGQLMQLQRILKKPSQKKQLQKALEQAASDAGVSVDALQETAIPTLGLNTDGQLEQSIGSYTALLSIKSSTQIQLLWSKADGKIQKSIPKDVKGNHAAELKDLKHRMTQIKKLLPTQRDRIEQFYLHKRSFNFQDWQTHYLNHPLVGQIARRLIWQINSDTTTITACYHEGQLVDVNDQPVTPSDQDTLKLWHPIDSSTDQTMTWRQWLDRHQISQPFKQAHREVYLLTDAEQQTEIYSNRFAGHILKQHQFASLCDARDWKYSLMGAFDSHNIPTVQIPAYGLRSEYWVQSILEEDQISEMGICLYLSTDQLRFYKGQVEHPMSLEDVPPIVLSEIMRDADLFVGVASIGNDPAWLDGGIEGYQTQYWHSYSFGELTHSAQTRRQILQRLIPRLSIASQCHFDDKFLIVKGSLRTYKIHLGSSNILMEPNDQYLCIVPKSALTNKATEKVFLPFEGDRTMAVILSKAMMLADDKKIKDATIVSQIKKH
ncbi:MAG TPA: hypothetical protein DCM28_19700 [Phycisphaerales bacterium]|nr:hypothetical protein [Phycisphaerales bacterium]HCD32710.1 hypothetical protein [Phycisphaerales bacterium]|tara:strand:+ start:49293 stop:51923 length:2631 start_codon:yes stop_codon:yes gene_type:complete